MITHILLGGGCTEMRWAGLPAEAGGGTICTFITIAQPKKEKIADLSSHCDAIGPRASSTRGLKVQMQPQRADTHGS